MGISMRQASNATKIARMHDIGACEMAVSVPAAAQRRRCAASSARRATLTALARLGEAAARAVADGAISIPRKRISAGAADGENDVRHYNIPDIDRARIRALRTVFAERLSEPEHDQLCRIIFAGRITPAQSEIVAALHSELWHQRMELQADQGGGNSDAAV